MRKAVYAVFFVGMALLLTACPGGGGAPADFTLSLNPTSLTVQQGDSGTTQLTLTPQNGFTGTVNLTLERRDGTAAPSGITLSPTSVSVNGSSPVTQTLTLSVGGGVATGRYDLRVKATSGSLNKTADLTLTVSAPSPNFTISLNPTSLTVQQGDSGTTQLTLTPQNGFTGTVNLTLERQDGTPAPSGITLSPTSVSVTGSSPVTQTLTLNVGTGVATGTYNLRVKATSGNLNKTANLTLTVSAPSPNFTISLNPTSLTVQQGDSGTTQLTLTPQNGFTGTVNLTLERQDGTPAPSGITLSPTSVSVTGSSPVTQTLTLNVGTGVATGTYNLRVKATSGNLNKTANLTLTVSAPPDFTISLNPTSLTLTQGESGKTTLTLTPQNGFTGTVTLSLVNPPTGVDISPKSVNVSGTRAVQQELTISTTASTPVGQHTLTLKAAQGNLEKTATLTLTVNQALAFTVNTTDDTIDVDPGNGKCEDANGNCSLRAAVMEANALSAPVVINIPAGTYRLTRTSSVDEQGDDLDLMSSITLRGADRDTTILDGNDTTRLIQVYQGKTVLIENLTIKKAPRYMNYNTVAAVWNDGGTLTLNNVTIKDNGGHGLWNEGTLTLTDVTVSGNGNIGVYNYYGTATLTNVTVSGNGDTGVYNYYGTATLTNVTVSGNSGGYGGGIYNGGTLTLTNVTVSGNSANYGGGIYNYNTLTLTNVTVSGNSAERDGGGIYNDYNSRLNVVFSTITNNTAASGGGLWASGTVRLKGVILAGNTATGGTGPECSGSLTSLGYNLIKSNADCAFTRDSTDILNQDPLLGPLGDNGGPVQTHLPQAGSPVLDKVPSASCTDLNGNPVSTDARGVRRPQGSACDMGAVERN